MLAVDFRSEYRYVLSDLKRIGILAAAMFATLIGLAVILLSLTSCGAGDDS